MSHSEPTDPTTHLRVDYYKELADLVDGDRNLSEMNIDHFEAALNDDWILALRNEEMEIQYAIGTEGDLIQIRDKGRTGEFGKPFGAYRDEFLDEVLSREYNVTVLYPRDSAFEVAEA